MSEPQGKVIDTVELAGIVCPVMSRSQFVPDRQGRPRTAIPVILCRRDCAIFDEDSAHPRGGQCSLKRRPPAPGDAFAGPLRELCEILLRDQAIRELASSPARPGRA